MKINFIPRNKLGTVPDGCGCFVPHVFRRAFAISAFFILSCALSQAEMITINDQTGSPTVTTDLGSQLAATSADMVTFFSFANRGITLPAGVHSLLFTSPTYVGGPSQIVDFATLYIVKDPVGQAYDLTLIFESMGAIGFNAQAAALLQNGTPEIAASGNNLNLSSLLDSGALTVSFNSASTPDGGQTFLLLACGLIGLACFGRKKISTAAPV